MSMNHHSCVIVHAALCYLVQYSKLLNYKTTLLNTWYTLLYSTELLKSITEYFTVQYSMFGFLFFSIDPVFLQYFHAAETVLLE